MAWPLDGVLYWNSVDDWVIVVKQKTLEWYEYAEFQRQVDILNSKIRNCESDLDLYPLSAVGRIAITKEMSRLNGFIDELREKWGVSDEQV